MKKCPICEKTFDDNLKFCQTDGTPLLAIEEEKPEDPYKTTVANANDLPIPPLDPFKTMVASPPPIEVKSEVKEEEVDMMKTLVASDIPRFEPVLKPEVKQEPKINVPPSPFDNVSSAQPEPPKFNEPNLNPPSFSNAPPIETPSESIPQKTFDSKPFEMSQPQTHKPNDFSGDSPYGDTKNVPIPSPFDLSMPPGYQIPSAPMPPYKEAEIEEIKAEAFNTPFANEVNQQNQQIEPQGWNPPPSPNTDWQNQQTGQNMPYQTSPTGTQGQNKSLAIGSLICGIVSLLSLVGSIIPFVGIICGGMSLLLAIVAIVTGFLGRSRANNNPAEYGGAGLALGGIITGILTLLGMVAFIVLVVAVIGFSNLR